MITVIGMKMEMTQQHEQYHYFQCIRVGYQSTAQCQQEVEAGGELPERNF
jgi:hypothetical protein